MERHISQMFRDEYLADAYVSVVAASAEGAREEVDSFPAHLLVLTRSPYFRSQVGSPASSEIVFLSLLGLPCPFNMWPMYIQRPCEVEQLCLNSCCVFVGSTQQCYIFCSQTSLCSQHGFVSLAVLHLGGFLDSIV